MQQRKCIFNDYILFQRKYKEKHRFIGVFERGSPKLLILDPELVNDIYVKHFKHFQINDSSSSVSKNRLKVFKLFA